MLWKLFKRFLLTIWATDFKVKRMKLILGIISTALAFSITEKVDDKEVFEDLVQPRGDCSGCKCVLVLHTNQWSDCQSVCNAVNNCAAWTLKSDKSCLLYTRHTGFTLATGAYGGVKGDFVMPGYQATGNSMMHCWFRSTTIKFLSTCTRELFVRTLTFSLKV